MNHSNGKQGGHILYEKMEQLSDSVSLRLLLMFVAVSEELLPWELGVINLSRFRCRAACSRRGSL